jgi:mRNA deadenylase 3'-5' endonuclease subunit Ccr4
MPKGLHASASASNSLKASRQSLSCDVQADVSILEWQHRWPRILDALKALDADIICLQEVNHFDDSFEPALTSLGYSGTFAAACAAHHGC